MSTGQKVIVIVGTNASGKSGLAIRLAQKYNGEVISADSRQVYKGLDIATGKVTTKEMDGVPHHLIDIVSPQKAYTAADFARDGQKALQNILNRGKLPIIAGGTGFYIDALLNPAILAAVPPNKKLRIELEKKSVEELFKQLMHIDPNRAKDLETKNEQNHKRRIVRSIEVARAPNILPNEGTSDVPSFEVLWIGLQWDKDELNKRIHTRLYARMRIGMGNEIMRLHKNGLSWKRMEELGLEYRYLSRYIRGKLEKNEMLKLLETKIIQYAKQQRTWFKRNENINWFDGGKLEGVEELVERFLE